MQFLTLEDLLQQVSRQPPRNEDVEVLKGMLLKKSKRDFDETYSRRHKSYKSADFKAAILEKQHKLNERSYYAHQNIAEENKESTKISAVGRGGNI